MLDIFKENIENNFSFLKGKKLLVACSGGVDSVVLVHLIDRLGYEIALAHCNFSLRGNESDKDADFVVDLAEKMTLPVFVESFDTHKYAEDFKISTQMAARDLRYTWFEALLEDFKYDYVLTAHHLDDDLETFFINLTRGSGLKGLIGIPKINKRIIRPMLVLTRMEVEAYAKENEISWREDKTNQEANYLRNKLRLEVLPKFKEVNASVLQNFQKTQNNLQGSYKLIEDYIELVYKTVVVEQDNSYLINIEKLKSFPNTKALIYELFKDFGFAQWDDILHLLESQTGKQVFSQTHRLIKNRGHLILSENDGVEKQSIYLIEEGVKEVQEPLALKFELADYIEETDRNMIQVDFHKLEYPLILRKWQKGDSFRPFGMKGRKKLSKYFKDEKVAQNIKEKTWLLVSGEEIVWVIGFRMAEDFKVTPTTEKVIRIRWQEFL